MAGRPMTNSLAFVAFLPVDGVSPELVELAEDETELVNKLSKINDEIKAVRAKAQDLLLDVTPRQIKQAKEKHAAEQKQAEEESKAAHTA